MVAHPKIRFLADDIWDTPEDGNRYEVIDGGLYVTPPPLVIHQFGLGRLYVRLANHINDDDLGIILPAPVGVKLDDENGLQPDLLFISNARRHIISERGVEWAPDLVVEVISPSTESRDRGIKKRRYAAAGVPRYWMLLPREKALEAYELGEDDYQLVGMFGPGSIFRPALFPGLEIPIDEIWR
jgi:Uma2 family endonuclease